MRSSLVAVNAKVETVQGSIQASSDTVESEGRQMMHCWITYINFLKNSKKAYSCVQTEGVKA